MWHVTSRIGDAVRELLYTRYLLTYLLAGLIRLAILVGILGCCAFRIL